MNHLGLRDFNKDFKGGGTVKFKLRGNEIVNKFG